ncbi:uncharacterized protein Z518_07250 [Rhinocladiella mackenziei CBS 650.93]|uniref:CCR4-NOT core complex subunit Not4 n=1 Tax=Rhinocladiella mackenziei CBS 650.93 TaxID=1442369 RepID=A0A0D2FNP3_9EURO|nr:uncharacterized protein Z518_07250 [Rhinocladiella mackenziei CBS 650.93]KIX03697.1 hypothetical protein Z518_07250 [Rhinocladiella mackenziei CBS 650.93]
MNRSQDTVIDDDEETCPLCIEEFDLTDKNFRPCPCGYQICQFCFNSLKNTYEKSTCPNCRRPYDEKTIQYKIPTAEEFKLDQLNKNKKQAAAKRKETEKREVENSARRNLAGVRVKQQNLVYVIGLIPQIKDEQALLQTLRGPDYFGQYGEIEKIVVSKAKPGAANQGIGVYVTYARKEDAALCINTVDGSPNGDRVLRAQFGTTKYCSAYLRGETCNNKNCSFLHETGEDGQHSSLQNEPHVTKIPPKPPMGSQSSHVSLPPRPQSTTQSTTTQHHTKEDDSSRKNSHDSSALPSTASWANASAPVARARRASQANSRATPSPQMIHASLSSQKPDESKAKETTPAPQSSTVSTKAVPPTDTSASKPKSKPVDYVQQQYDAVLRGVSPNFRFVYDDSCLSPEVRAAVDDMPPLIDPYGGAKRRAMRERDEAERAKVEAEAKAKLEAQATSAAEDTLDDENVVAGSLALGGEPEDDPRSSSVRGAIGRPPQPLSDQFSSMNLNTHSLTPQQRQQLALINTGNLQQAADLGQSAAQNTAFEMSDFDRRGPQYSQAQYEQISSHQRHGSRYFNNDSKAASNANRFQGQQQTFYSSGVQGPPPGLPTAGTPPVSGGGMFAHGQNFTNPGFGPSKDTNTEVYSRNRSGTNQGHDMSKRELLLSLQNNPLRSPPLSAPAPGVLNPLYGQYQGTYQDPGLVKQRKKGKKHRHANTSSSGGGVEHLADPSIVSTRVHQGNTTGQGLFGGNQVDEKNFPPLPIRSEIQPTPIHSRVSSYHSFQSSGLRSSTPKIPPGFELIHGHPMPPSRQESPAQASQVAGQRITSTACATVAPAVPLVPVGPRTSSPKLKIPEITNEGTKNVGEDENVSIHAGKQRNEVSDASYASPSKEATRQKFETDRKPDVLDKSEENFAQKDEALLPSKSGDTESKGKAVAQKPEKREPPPPGISANATAAPSAASAPTGGVGKSGAPILDAAVVGTSGTLSSRPATPVTTTPSDTSKASMARPRTLRVTTGMTTKTAEPTPASATTEKSGILPPISVTKRGSRRPSLSSAQHSRPSTPAMSERFVSHDVSRASSPPPNVVGSAPERVKSKNQQKKDRRDKAKKTTEASEAGSASTPPTVEEVAPVIARQKKQKRRMESSPVPIVDDKPKDKPADDVETPTSKPEEVIDKQTPEADSKKASSKTQEKERTLSATNKTAKGPNQAETLGTPPPATPNKEPTSRGVDLLKAPYTLRDLYNEVGKVPSHAEKANLVQKLLDEHVSAMPKIISSMIQSGDLSKDHPWLNPPNFNSAAYKLAPDARRGQEYLDGNGYSANDAFGYIYLPLKEKQALKDGHAVSVADAGDRRDDLLKRCLVTPSGWVLRHLSADESEKILELEERRQMYMEEFGEVGTMDGLGVLEADDFTNLGGGMERLGRQGEHHGVVWVTGDADQMGEDDEFDAFDDEDGEIDGEIGVSDEEPELEHEGLDDDDDNAAAADAAALDLQDSVNMPGAWDLLPSASHSGTKSTGIGAGRVMSLPGLNPHSDLPSLRSPNTQSNVGNAPHAPLGHRHGSNTRAMSSKANMASSGQTQSQNFTTAPTNLRALDSETLQKRVQEKQRELEQARKEMDKIEKLWTKKSKDIGRWREGLTKA